MEAEDRSNEFIWIMDFRDRNLGNLVFQKLGVRTYGELAFAYEIGLLEGAIDDNEQKRIERMLIERGLREELPE